jgi:hypothetical protein
MARALRAFGVAFEEFDVDADRALRDRYGDRVPVLTDAAGDELCHGRLDPAVLSDQTRLVQVSALGADARSPSLMVETGLPVTYPPGT